MHKNVRKALKQKIDDEQDRHVNTAVLWVIIGVIITTVVVFLFR